MFFFYISFFDGANIWEGGLDGLLDQVAVAKRGALLRETDVTTKAGDLAELAGEVSSGTTTVYQGTHSLRRSPSSKRRSTF
jgi:hypothetical protein